MSSGTIGRLVGGRIRFFRGARGMSQSALGGQVGLTGAWVSAVERGERSAGADRLSTLVPLLLALKVNLRQFLTAPVPGVPPFPVEWLAQVDEALGYGATNAGMAPIARMLEGTGPDIVVMARDPQGAWYLMHRREAIKRGLNIVGVASIGAFTLDQDQANAVTDALDTQTPNGEAVSAYRGILDALRHAEDQVGSAPSLRQAAEIQLDTLKGWLAAIEPGGLFDDLARLTAEYAISVGWMHYDAGGFHRAVIVYRDALPLAQSLKDRALAAYLSRLTAKATSDMGNLAAAVQYVERAAGLVSSTDAWRVRAYVEAQRSEIHARLGDRNTSSAALGLAEDALGRTDGVDTPYVYYFRSVDGFRGRGLAHLGRHDEALEAFERKIRTNPSEYVRDRAEYLADLAESRAGAGDVAMAAGSATEAAALLRTTSSGRIVRRLRILHGRLAVMARGTDVARVKELGAQVQAL